MMTDEVREAELRDRQIVVVLRAQLILAAEQFPFDRFAMPALAGERVRNLRDKVSPFRDGRSDEAHEKRRAARYNLARDREQTGNAASLVFDVEFERLGKEHHRASSRLALSAGKACGGALEKE